MTLLTIQEPHMPKPGKTTWMDHPLLRLGFRPFYFLAAAFAMVSVPLWMASYLGWIDAANINLNWHMHEMIFGFAIAVIVGFLYTAGRNWTGLWTPTKNHLAALAALWVAGRLAMLAAPPVLAALIDILFLPLATWPLYRVLKRADNRRNMFLVGLLTMLALANALFHGAALGWLQLSPFKPLHAAIMIIVMIESVIAGRIIPGFTANVVSGTKPVIDIRQDKIGLVVTALACTSWVIGFPGPMVASFAFAAACSQFIRLAGWRPHTTVRHPLLWILHLSYAWIPVGFVLLSLSAIHLVPVSAALHVLTIGSMAGLIIGMITRTALGHTGRTLKAGKAEVIMYVLLQLGVICRLVAALQTGTVREVALMAAGSAWAIAFFVYLCVYAPYLFSARIDGKEG